MSGRRIAWQDGDDRVQRWIDDWLAAESEITSEVLHQSAQRSLFLLRNPRELAIDETGRAAVREVVLKIHHTQTGPHRRRESIKRHIGYSPVLREWRALVELHAARVPVPEPLAWGLLPGGDPLLATEHFPGRDLARVLSEVSSVERTQWLDRLAEAVASLHAAGFRHGDLHLGNLRAHGDHVVILDVQRARRVRHRNDPLRDLAQLDFSIARRGFAVGDRRHLRRALGDPPDLDAAARRFVRDFLRGRTRRELQIGENWERWRFEVDGAGDRRAFDGLRDHSGAGRAVEAALRAAIDDPRPGDRRDGRTRITTHGDTEAPLIVKRWLRNAGGNQIAARMRRSPAQQAFRIGQRLALLGRYGARTLAALDETRNGRPVAGWLVLESVGACDLDAYHPDSEQAARRCLVSLANWIAEWHAWGIEHLDLKAGNVRLEERDGVLRFWLIDLEDVRFRRRLRDADRLRALVQLNASLADEDFSIDVRRAALDAYLERLPFERRNRRSLVESIVPRSLARKHRWRGVGCRAAASRTDA